MPFLPKILLSLEHNLCVVDIKIFSVHFSFMNVTPSCCTCPETVWHI